MGKVICNYKHINYCGLFFLLLVTTACDTLGRPNSNLSESNLNTGSNATGTSTGTFKMAILGDSINTGLITDTTYGSGLPDEYVVAIKAIIRKSNVTLDLLNPDKALSLIIPQLETNSNRLDLNAFAGNQTWSHAEKISTLVGKSVNAINLAVSGADMSDANSMVTKLLEADPARAVEYIVFALGANDFCQATEKDLFQQNLSSNLQNLRAEYSDAVILVVDIPNIPKIATSPSIVDLSVFFVTPKNLSEITDDPIIEILNVGLTCESYLTSETTCSEAANAIAWEEYNQIIHSTVTGLKDEKLVLFDTDQNFSLDTKYLAADCFHPSELGQKEFADKSWNAVAQALQL